jgi:hypothetical protein
MWVCFNNAFVSAVQDRNNKDRLVIRARRKEHLENIFPNKEIVIGGSTDYNYRVFCDKNEFADLVANNIKNINYDNFKNSVEDNDLHKLYANFWYLHRAYQN